MSKPVSQNWTFNILSSRLKVLTATVGFVVGAVAPKNLSSESLFINEVLPTPELPTIITSVLVKKKKKKYSHLCRLYRNPCYF